MNSKDVVQGIATNKTYGDETFSSQNVLILSPKTYGDEMSFITSSQSQNVLWRKFSSLTCLIVFNKKIIGDEIIVT